MPSSNFDQLLPIALAPWGTMIGMGTFNASIPEPPATEPQTPSAHRSAHPIRLAARFERRETLLARPREASFDACGDVDVCDSPTVVSLFGLLWRAENGI